MYSNSTTATTTNVAFTRFLKTVFNYMSGGVAISGISAYVTLHSAIGLQIVSNPVFLIAFMVIWFGFGIFAHKIISKVSTGAGIAMFIGFAVLTGMAFAPVVAKYAAGSITTAFFVSSAIFAGMSMFGLNTKKSLEGWGSFLKMASIGLIAAIVINIVLSMAGVAVAGMSMVISFLIIPLVAAGVAYELNMLRDTFHQFGDDERAAAEVSIVAAVNLYTSFVVLFLNILQVMGFLGGDE